MKLENFRAHIKGIRDGAPERKYTGIKRQAYWTFGRTGYRVFSVRDAGTERSRFEDIQFLLLRCELAWIKYRDPFAHLVAVRLMLWMAKSPNVEDKLQLSREKRQWLDREIREFFGVKLPRKHPYQDAAYGGMAQKLRAGFADNRDFPSSSRHTISPSRTTDRFRSVPMDSHNVRKDLNSFPSQHESRHT